MSGNVKANKNIWVPQRQSTNFRLKVSSSGSERCRVAREAFDTLPIIPHGSPLASKCESGPVSNNVPEEL